MHHEPPHSHPLELWVGPEPTVSRLGADTLDQLELTGCAQRPGDLDRLGSLGAAAVRFPLMLTQLVLSGGGPGVASTTLDRARVGSTGMSAHVAFQFEAAVEKGR